MTRKIGFFRSCLVLLISILILSTYGDVEFCSKSATDGIYWLNKSQCEFGILFPHPVMVDCFTTTNKGVMKADVCNDTDVDPNAFPIMLQYISQNEDIEIDEGDTCNKAEKCGSQELISDVSWTSKIVTPSLMHTNEPWPDESSGLVTDPVVGNQTLRMFKHLMGLDTNDEETGPVLRVVTLLKKSFEILGKFCSNRYVSLDFGEDILTAFLFLLGESDTSRIMDIGMDDYRIIDGALNDCLDQPMPFKFKGSTCKTYGYIETVNTTKGLVKIALDEFSWKANKYDIPVDVTWSTADFVHGLCYGTFKNHVNSHHLYQQAIERLFTPEIVARWDKPMILARQEMWDNFFSANVRNTIENLEYCVQAAYYDAPFLHRLERILKHYDGPRSVLPTTEAPITSKPVFVGTHPPAPDGGSPAPAGEGTPAPTDPGAPAAPAPTDTASVAPAPDDAAAGAAPTDEATDVSAPTDEATVAPAPDDAAPAEEATDAPAPTEEAAPVEEAAAPAEDAVAPAEEAAAPAEEAAAPAEEAAAPAAADEATPDAAAPAETKRRRKRDATLALPAMDDLRFYCFKTEAERDELMEKYKTTVCQS